MYYPVATHDGGPEEMSERGRILQSSGGGGTYVDCGLAPSLDDDDDRHRHGSIVSNHDYSTFPTSRPRIGFWQARWSKVKSSSIRSRVLTCLALVLIIIGAVGLSGALGRIKLPEHVSAEAVRDWQRWLPLPAGWDARRDRTNVLFEEEWKQPRREYLGDLFESASGNSTPGVAELLIHPDPTLSLYDNLKPNLKYLMTDSWSGLGGQFTTVLPLLFLASTTSRIAVIPSFNDEHHYGADVIVKMSMLYDLERFRQITGILFVEQDDVKVRDPKHTLTQEDDVGCYVSNWWFDQGLSYGHHNIHQTIIRIDRPGVAGKDWADWTYESYAMFDMDFERRMEKSREILAKEGITGDRLPRNLQTATKTSSLMCYTNLWGLKRAGQDEVSKEQQKLMAPQWKEFNHQPEWHYIGRYLDFAPKIWEIALASVRASLGVTTIPQELITMHIRRGDFLTWCEKGTDCTPCLDAFVAAVKDLKAELKMSSPELDVDKIQVLITTDEQDDRAILDQIAANGWVISQTPSSMIEEAIGDAWKWADSAIAQAILSLGARGFVGTSNSQVSQLTQLRIQSYYKRKHAPTRMVDRTGKFMRKRSLPHNPGFSKRRLAIR